jgi:hypothetical protein
MNVRIVEEGHTIIILTQLELFAVIDMLGVAAGQTEGRLSHDLAGFGSAIAEPIRAKLSDAMEGVTGKYEEPEEFIVPAEMQSKIDSIMARIFGGGDERTGDENPPENASKASKRRILPDDN